MSKITSVMTPKQYQRELREILCEICWGEEAYGVTYDDLFKQGNIDNSDVQPSEILKAHKAVLDLNERALPKEKPVRKNPKTISSMLKGQPYQVDNFNSGHNKAISDIRQIIGKGK